MTMRLALTLGLLVLLAPPAPGQEPDRSWTDGLAPEVVERLRRDGVIVLDEPLHQVFQAYLDSELPVFVTSDAMLSAYHVLLEDSLRRLEIERARRLPAFLREAWPDATASRELAADEKLLEAALRRARITLGTALLLLGQELPGDDPSIPAIARAEAHRVEAAEGIHLPQWLGPASEGFLGIDYGRFRPVGFYAGSDRLRRYFRTVSFLQAVPFRADREEELLAALLLRRGISGLGKAFLKGYEHLVGRGDGPAIHDLPEGPTSLAAAREACGKLAPERVQDRVASGPGGTVLRLLPAAATPEGVLFSITAAGPAPGRTLPRGLEVAAALGGAWARRRLAKEEGPDLATKAVESWPELSDACLYDEYLRCLAALLDAPAKGAPALFAGEAWAVKSTQTALGGWALLRHTWCLHAERSAGYLGSAGAPPGFVEPDPEFFSRFADLVERTHAYLKKHGALSEAGVRRELAEGVPVLVRLLRETKATETENWDFWEALAGLSEEDRRAALSGASLARGLGVDHVEDGVAGLGDAFPRRLEAAARAILDDERPCPPPLRKAVAMRVAEVEEPWTRLAALSRRLASLARKQLRGEAFETLEEKMFLYRIGEALGQISLHHHDAYQDPRDDAPRIATVHDDPAAGRRLLVGVARPRPILVLYPWKGEPVLCRGGVLSYRELAGPKSLTDAEWMARLDSDDPPSGPAWRKGIEVAVPRGK
jgi:hypothetical protein